jgi:hypothetical protein
MMRRWGEQHVTIHAMQAETPEDRQHQATIDSALLRRPLAIIGLIVGTIVFAFIHLITSTAWNMDFNEYAVMPMSVLISRGSQGASCSTFSSAAAVSCG